MENKGREKGETSKGKGKKLKYRPLKLQYVAKFRCLTCSADLYTEIHKSKCIMEGVHEVMDIEDFRKWKKREVDETGGFRRKFLGGHDKDDLVVCTDASTTEKGTCYGVILRSGSLNYIYGFSQLENTIVLNNNIAEARAICHGLETALERTNCKKIVVYSDSLLAVTAYNTGETSTPDFSGYIPLQEINEMRFRASEAAWKRTGVLDENHNPTPRSIAITVCYIYRELNSIADIYSKKHLTREYLLEDDVICDILKKDKYLLRFIEPRR